MYSLSSNNCFWCFRMCSRSTYNLATNYLLCTESLRHWGKYEKWSKSWEKLKKYWLLILECLVSQELDQSVSSCFFFLRQSRYIVVGLASRNTRRRRGWRRMQEHESGGRVSWPRLCRRRRGSLASAPPPACCCSSPQCRRLCSQRIPRPPPFLPT